MDQQAEDVMGSLLKDYLNPLREEDEHASEGSNKEITIAEEKDSSRDNVPENEGCSGQDPENDIADSNCPEGSGKEPQSQLQKDCTSEGNSSVQPFKNVVAIVDPPRGGLHPTVSNTLLCMWTFTFIFFSMTPTVITEALLLLMRNKIYYNSDHIMKNIRVGLGSTLECGKIEVSCSVHPMKHFPVFMLPSTNS